ncbi:MAG: hypothetical protein JO269_10740 [Burkholderiaceae bacterium]|nr:hypothetical protein [Burkholderiaceae bacterium]
MNPRQLNRYSLRAVAIAALLLTAAHSAAQEAAKTPDELSARYPSGSIQSVDTANRALAEVDKLRSALDQKFATEQHECYSRFFATSCVDAAKEKHRLALAQIRKIEVEADTFNRSARVLERDQHLAERRAKDAGNPPKPIADTGRAPAAPVAHPEGDRVAEHEAKLKQQQAEQQQDAQKRADNVAAYEKKVQDAEARQRDVAAKKAEKAKEAADKAAKAAAASDATAAPASAAAPASKP